MTNEKDKSGLHARVTALVESTHCPKHGMEWEVCCYSEVVPELHNKITDLITTIRKEEREAAFKSAAGIARMMAAGETYETGRQKALNIAAALEAAATAKEQASTPAHRRDCGMPDCFICYGGKR